MPRMNFMETIGAIFAGLITVAIAAVLVKPKSTTAAIITATGNAFGTAVNAAEGGGATQ